jgi:AcrR family transcriptional regulator
MPPAAAGVDPGSEAPRQALIEAMAESCMRCGYLETSVEDLLAATGVSRPEFDRHFADKEACGIAAVEAILAEGMKTVSVSFTGDISEAEIVLRALLGLLELFAERPAMGSLAMTDSRQRMPAAAFERYAGGFAILRAMLDRLRSDHRIGADAPPCAARGALGGSEAVVRRELAEARAARLPELLPDLIYSAIVPFLGQREALRIAAQAGRLVEERLG